LEARASLVMAARIERFFDDVVGRYVRVEPLEDAVVGGTQKGEGGDERTGAYARYQLEIRSVAGLGPAVEESGTERTVVAAGDGQEDRRH